MSFFTGPIYSQTLDLETQLSIILPFDTKSHRNNNTLVQEHPPKQTVKTLFLLHGISDSSTMWARKTRIEILAEKYDLAVIMPECQRSFYLNMKNGYSFWDYITKELPSLVSSMFHISTAPENLLLAGLSMGGYGAMRCALTIPSRFSMIGCFSGGLDLFSLMDDPEYSDIIHPTDRGAVFGKGPIPQNADLYYLLENPEIRNKVPLYISCGKQDRLYNMTKTFTERLSEKNFHFKFEEWDGIHDWYFWDTSIEKMLKYYFHY